MFDDHANLTHRGLQCFALKTVPGTNKKKHGMVILTKGVARSEDSIREGSGKSVATPALPKESPLSSCFRTV
jgi:hypothetical protein